MYDLEKLKARGQNPALVNILFGPKGKNSLSLCRWIQPIVVMTDGQLSNQKNK